ncbi:MAG: DUF3263 domain-containing protein [Comamonadaceae bacterium]|nr:MAG: DUF3263 domain-containing protein [Comamonadaceae bacterium]
MTRDEQEMLAFARKWLPFGGGEEHILPEFGLTPVVFYQRLLAMVTKTRANEVDFATRRHLREFCLLKLSHANPRKPAEHKRSRSQKGLS